MCTIRIAPHLSCTVQWQQAIRLPVMTVSTSRAAGTLLPARVDEGVVAAAGYSNPQTTNRSFNRRGEQLRRPVLGLAARGLTTFSYHCSKSNSCVVERAAAGSAGGAAVGISSNTRMNKSLPPLTAVLGRLLSTSTCNFRCFIARAAGGNNTEVLVSGRMQMGGDSRRALASMSEAEFHDTADETLESIHDAVEGALEDGFDGEFDCNMSQGVLNIVVTGGGTWVLNKQAPNRQIWWSSPISGPMRFEHDNEAKRWLNTRDGVTELRSLLTTELMDKCGIDLDSQ